MAFLFKIQIQGISKPPVWRKLLVPEDFTFNSFHKAIQNAFGWYDSHNYEFSPSGWGSSPSIGSQFEKYFDDGAEKDANMVKLKDIFKKENQKFMYIYDFGDEWRHKITLEKIIAEKPEKALCLDGKGACPPEDCGGVYGYLEFQRIINDSQDPEHVDMMDWAVLNEGEKWEDRYPFDLEEANKMVQSV